MADSNQKTDPEYNSDDTASRLEHIVGKISKKKEERLTSSDFSLKTVDPGKVTPPKQSEPVLNEEELRKKYASRFSEKLGSLSASDEKEKQAIIERFTLSELAINKIESGPVQEDKAVYHGLEQKIKELSKVTLNFKDILDLKLPDLRKIVREIIEQTGPNKNSSILLLNLIDSAEFGYHIAHATNVCIFTLVIAIETSKMMMQKILLPEVSKDFSKTRLCSLKTFNEDELIDLGLAALVHDIHLKKMFPDIDIDTSLSFRDQLEYKRHPVETARMLEQININREIKIAVLQHHERLDGKGYPDGIHESVFSRYSRVIALADRYESLSFLNPFTPAIGPMGSINRLLKHEKAGFDGDLIISFLKSSSLFPPGSFLLLTSGEIGMVYEVDNEKMQRPKVKILFSKNKKQVKEPILLDLNNYPELRVERAVHPREIKTALPMVKQQLGLI